MRRSEQRPAQRRLSSDAMATKAPADTTTDPDSRTTTLAAQRRALPDQPRNPRGPKQPRSSTVPSARSYSRSTRSPAAPDPTSTGR